jgi:hypothetical protein
MSKARAATVALIGAFIGMPGVGTASPWVGVGGSSCQPTANGYSGINYGSYGYSSTAAAGTTAICPLAEGTTSTYPQSIAATYLRYTDGSSTSTFRCRVEQGLNDGSTYFSSYKYGCSTVGGCTTGAVSFTGTGYLQWTAAELGSNLNTYYLDGNYAIECDVPGPDSGSYSKIISAYFEH